MNEPVYIVGIDLGTTNAVAACTPVAADRLDEAEIRILEIAQLVDAGVVESRPLLPSFVLLPEAPEVPANALALPWDSACDMAVGEYARNRGAELPQRLISSSKSWLCNTLVDRNAPILPWEGTVAGSPGGKGRKLSPVEASAAILTHLRDSWNFVMARSAQGTDEALRLENQLIYLTVPASFDAVARELTVTAAQSAGLRHITLLEEPQAAFYAWIGGSRGGWRKTMGLGDKLLVCDIGGGTTDLTLVGVSEEGGELTLQRLAVGNHLLVGGDNMDLTLAYALARQLSEKGTRLDNWQMSGLWHSCRRAKERILSDPACERVPVTVLGRGSKLIGGAITTELTRDTILNTLKEGFLPMCAAQDRPTASQRTGIREFGLAYEADPAITRHLAHFLGRHDADGRPLHPSAVLFNGGVMKADVLREQVLRVVNSWSPDTPAREIATSDFDLAVARGAAYYGLARLGRGVRIRGGLGRSYYIKIAAAMPAVPGIPAPTKALCVASFGMEEGTTAAITGQEFVLQVGEPVTFEFLGSTTRPDDAVGTIVEDWSGEIETVTTLETTLEGEAGQAIPVTLELVVTEVGTLSLYCVSTSDDRKWKLEFNVRER